MIHFATAPFYLNIGCICIPSSASFAVGTTRLNFATSEFGFLIESSPPIICGKTFLHCIGLKLLFYQFFQYIFLLKSWI